MLEKLFKLKESGTTARTEILAGMTTFMTMAYILAVNPNILSAAGIPRGGVFVATLVDCIDFHSVPFRTQGICAILALVGTVLTGVMLAKHLKGAVLFGTLGTLIGVSINF